MWQSKRSSKPEIIDLGEQHYTREEYDGCLQLLCRVNRFLGGFKAVQRALAGLKGGFNKILEIGCGGGYLCQHVARSFPHASVVGVDISHQAVEHARQRLADDLKQRVCFNIQNDKTLAYADNSFDVVTSMLVCHHMHDEEVVVFLQESYRVCAKAVIISDLQRHLLAYLGFSLIAPFAFPNRLIWHDGRLSVRRAFRRHDWLLLLQKAGFKESQYRLKWHWAFRWTLTLIKT